MDSFEEGKVSKQKRTKLPPRFDGPFEVLEKINPNAYKIDLPREYGVSATFNVADFSPYLDEEDEVPSLRTNSSQVGEDDGDHPEALSMVKAAQGPNQVMAFSLALHDLSQPGLCKKWPGFLTFVS